MTDWCSCNKLKEAEEKAAKWDALSSMTIEMRPIAPETNYQRYFGTPEKAAEMAKLICDLFRRCDGCPFKNADCVGLNDTEVWLGWLESEVE